MKTPTIKVFNIGDTVQLKNGLTGIIISDQDGYQTVKTPVGIFAIHDENLTIIKTAEEMKPPTIKVFKVGSPSMSSDELAITIQKEVQHRVKEGYVLISSVSRGGSIYLIFAVNEGTDESI